MDKIFIQPLILSEFSGGQKYVNIFKLKYFAGETCRKIRYSKAIIPHYIFNTVK